MYLETAENFKEKIHRKKSKNVERNLRKGAQKKR